MLPLTRRYLLIIVQNRWNPDMVLHKIQHSLAGREWNHGNIALMSNWPVVESLSHFGRVLEIGYFDVPWFVLEIYESGAFLRELIPRSLSRSALELRRSRFEDLPSWCKKHLAHHSYVLFKKSAD